MKKGKIGKSTFSLGRPVGFRRDIILPRIRAATELAIPGLESESLEELREDHLPGDGDGVGYYFAVGEEGARKEHFDEVSLGEEGDDISRKLVNELEKVPHYTSFVLRIFSGKCLFPGSSCQATVRSRWALPSCLQPLKTSP